MDENRKENPRDEEQDTGPGDSAIATAASPEEESQQSRSPRPDEVKWDRLKGMGQSTSKSAEQSAWT